MFGGGSGRIVGDHAGGAPVSGEHHICGGCASAGEFGGQTDAAGVGRDAAVDACGLGGGGKAPCDDAGGERDDANSLVSGCVSARSERRAAATPSLTYRRSVVSPAGFVFEVRTRTRTPEVGASASVTSDQRRAATSDRRNPAIKSKPAITASSRPRRAAVGGASMPRRDFRGRWHVARTAERWSAVKASARPRPRSAAVRRKPARTRPVFQRRCYNRG